MRAATTLALLGLLVTTVVADDDAADSIVPYDDPFAYRLNGGPAKNVDSESHDDSLTRRLILEREMERGRQRTARLEWRRWRNLSPRRPIVHAPVRTTVLPLYRHPALEFPSVFRTPAPAPGH